MPTKTDPLAAAEKRVAELKAKKERDSKKAVAKANLDKARAEYKKVSGSTTSRKKK